MDCSQVSLQKENQDLFREKLANLLESGAWLVLPSYMGYNFAKDILRGLAKASGDSSSKPAWAVTPTKYE